MLYSDTFHAVLELYDFVSERYYIAIYYHHIMLIPVNVTTKLETGVDICPHGSYCFKAFAGLRIHFMQTMCTPNLIHRHKKANNFLFFYLSLNTYIRSNTCWRTRRGQQTSIKPRLRWTLKQP